MFKKLSIFAIINLLFLTILCTYSTAFDGDNGYVTIIGTIKVVDYDNNMITVLSEVKKGDVREFDIKISSGASNIFVRGINGLLSVEKIKTLLPGDDVSIKRKERKGEYETSEIEKREKVKK